MATIANAFNQSCDSLNEILAKSLKPNHKKLNFFSAGKFFIKIKDIFKQRFFTFLRREKKNLVLVFGRKKIVEGRKKNSDFSLFWHFGVVSNYNSSYLAKFV